MGIDRERAVARCVEGDRARAFFTGNLHRGRGRALRYVRQSHIEGDHATGVFRDVGGRDAHRRGVDRVADLSRGRGSGQADGLEVAASHARDGGGKVARVNVDVRIGRGDEQAALAVGADGDVVSGLANQHVGRGGALRRVGQFDGEGHARVVFRDVAGADADRGAVGHVSDIRSGGRAGHAGGFEVAAGDRRERGRDCNRINIDVSPMGGDRERAVAGCVECDRARAFFTGNLHRGAGRALRHVRQVHVEGDHAAAVFRDVGGRDAHRGGVVHVADVGRRCRSDHAGGFEVAAGDRRDGGRHRCRVDVDVSTVGVDRERAVASRVECDRACAFFSGNLHRGRGRALRCVGQVHIEGDHAAAVLRDVGGRDAGLGDIAVVHNIGAEVGAGECEDRETAIGHGIHTIHCGKHMRGALHIVVVRAACDGQVAVRCPAGNRHRLRDSVNRDVELQIALRRMIDAEAEGDAIAFDNIAGN